MVGLRQSIAPVAYPALPGRGSGEAGHHGGYQAQCDKRRDRDGYCEYQAELLKEPAGGARQESDRHKDGDQDGSCSDHRKKHFTRADHGSGTGPGPFGSLTLYALQHHDGVVDNQPCCEHQCQQRQNVDREAERPTGGQCAQQRNWYGNRGDQCEAHRTRKQSDRANHHQDRYQQRCDNFSD